MYKPPAGGASAGVGGAWGAAAATQPKRASPLSLSCNDDERVPDCLEMDPTHSAGKLADGSDFLTQLAASLDKVPAS